MAQDLTAQVLKTIRNYSMTARGDIVLVAVSGGPDSVFLMYALNHLRKKLGFASVAVCNLDHGIRGKESKRDSRFVAAAAKRLGLAYFHKTINLSKVRAKGLSTEEVARSARYKFFAEAAVKSNATVLATGHTLDDQAETVLMRFIKGASLKGLVGIAPVRCEGKLKIVRPLIEIGKEAIVRYLNANDIAYCVDSTNLEDIYFRNVIRREVLPFLERFNPRLKRSLFNLAESLREDFEYIQNEKLKFARRAMSAKKGSVEIALKDIVMQPRTIQKEVLRDCLQASGGEVKKLSFRHWKEVEVLMNAKGKGFSVDLPGAVRVSRTERYLTFAKI